MKKIVECVPNFSEGRRPDVIHQIVEAMRTVPSVQILDVQSDVDHNRSVVTMVGPPGGVKEAAFSGIASAAGLINLDEHKGEHPRFGAADVVPFIPVQGVTLEDCVQLAHSLGRRVGEELGVPVYLYEAAATRPERVNLADVRRGEYESLKAEMGTNPDRAPDFGPARMGTAGAVAIGARPFLLAFNVYLNSADESIAQRIARAVRHSSGGLRYVKALGLLVQGQAQVSMNLTDTSRTPIHRVFELIHAEAARYGTAVTRSELVGLVPQKAMLDAAAWYLQLDLDADQILENRLQRMEDEKTALPTAFLDAVAADTPAPGGGSVAAVAGAMAAALTAMVAHLTLGRKRYQAVHDEIGSLLAEAEGLRTALTARAAQDAEAYDHVIAAFRLPKGTNAERKLRVAAIQEALVHAAEVPLATARDAVAAVELAARVARIGNVNALTDAGTAAHMARAGFEGAVLNVRINADQISDQQRVTSWRAELDKLRTRCNTAFEDTLQALDARWSID